MKRKIKIFSIFLILSLMQHPIAYSNAAVNVDAKEEQIKHSKTTELTDTQKNQVSDDLSNIELVRSRAEVSKEYREMDKKTADILKSYCGDEYYLLTLSYTKEDRIKAMHKIVDIYNNVGTSEQKTLLSYISSYAPYAGDSSLVSACKELQPKEQMFKTSASSYSRSDAAQWAIDNYNNYNSNYPDCRLLGGDCANFVSQCMHVGGGMSMQDTWYCYRKNTTYLKPTTTAQLNYTWNLADPSPWISAKEFKNFWSSSSRSTTYTYTKSEYTGSSSPAYAAPIYKGHAMSFCNKVLWWYEAAHTVIIVDYDYSNSDYIYAAHSNAKKDGKVKTGISNYDAVVFYCFN